MKYPTYKLGQICIIERGGSPRPIKNYLTNADDGINWIKIGDATLSNKYIYKTAEKIKPEGLSKTRKVEYGDLILSNSMSFGRPYIMRTSGCIHDGWVVFRLNKEIIDEEYLYTILTSNEVYAQFNHLATGSTVKNLNIDRIKEVVIPLPSLSTQHQIVSRIETLFAELDKAEERLRTAQQQLKTYKQAVLKSAFEECTEMRKVLELSSIVTSGSRGWAKYYTDKKNARFVRITDLTRDKIILQNNSIQYISLPENVEGKRSLLQPNDVLVSITADLGSIALIPSNIGEAYINQHIAMIRFKNPKQGEFMAYYLRSEYGQRSLLKNKRGGGKLGLGLDDIRNTNVPFVNEEEATEIVHKIETRLSQAEAVEARIAETLQQTEALRQSILKKAFSGEFVSAGSTNT